MSDKDNMTVVFGQRGEMLTLDLHIEAETSDGIGQALMHFVKSLRSGELVEAALESTKNLRCQREN